MPPFGDFMDLRRHEADAGFRVRDGLGIDTGGALTLRLDPSGPLYVNARGEVAVRTGDGVSVETASPPRLVARVDKAPIRDLQQAVTAGATALTALTTTVDANTTAIAANAASLASNTSKARGTATLVAGTVTVAAASVATGDLIFVQNVAPGGTAGFLVVQNIVDGVSFDVLSSDAADTSTVAWMVLSP